jgi:hypothetical protein
MDAWKAGPVAGVVFDADGIGTFVPDPVIAGIVASLCGRL